MNRRHFSKLSLLSLPALKAQSLANTAADKQLIKPKALKKGDRIGLIAPGSSLTSKRIEKAQKNVRDLGFKPVLSKNARAKHGYLAGTDEQRLSDIHDMFEDDSISGIWCLRGGYGCTRLLPKLNKDLIGSNPKALIGYSDITALHQYLYKEIGLVSFHGPVASSSLSEYSKKSLIDLVCKRRKKIKYFDSKQEGLQDFQIAQVGRAKGPIVGGNLSLLAAMCGTNWSPDFTDKIVFIEDIGEKPYRIDRMMTQLVQSTNLMQAAGIIFGQFFDCEAKNDESSLSLDETMTQYSSGFNGPIIRGFSFGHVDDQCTFPVGIGVKFDTEKKSLLLQEAAVID